MQRRRDFLLFLAAGFELAWLMREIPVGGPCLVGLLIGLYGALSLRLKRDRRSAFPAALALLERLERETEAGADFFAALGVARDGLTEGRLRRSVDAALAAYGKRLPTAACLRPLAGPDPVLAWLAADVRRAGWEASAGLAGAIRLARAAAIRRWEGGRERRARLDRLERRLPMLRGIAVGTAAGVAAVLFFVSPAASVPPIIPEVRAAEGFEPAGRPVAADRLPAPLLEAEPSHIPITDAFPRPLPAPAETCRVRTGLPGGYANVRDKPGMAGRVVYYAPEGARLDVTGDAGDYASGFWLHVRMEDGRSGWIFAPLCAAGDE